MARSRPLGLFILVLCIVACVCVHGDVSEAEATQAVKDAQESAKKVFNNVKGEVRETLIFQNDINKYKRNAEQAATEAEKAAKGNSEAETIAGKANKASDEALKLYPKASELTTKYLESMKKLRTKAEGLDEKATDDLFISRFNEDNYTKIKEDADAVKAQVEALDKEYNKELPSFSAMYATQNEMLKFVSAAQLARYHVDAIVGVAKIDTLLKSAEADIKLTEQKKDATNATVQEVKALYDNSPEKLSQHIQRLYSRTEYEFDSASDAVKQAKKAREGMLEQKAQANDALGKVKDETDVEKAKDEAGVVDHIAKKAEKNVEEIKRALDSATTSTTIAGYQKNAAVNELNKKDKKPDATQNDNKMNPQDSANTHKPVKDTTESPVESGTNQPTITNPDKAGRGGTEHTPRAGSDSAMTVSVPLLLALIACAALH